MANDHVRRLISRLAPQGICDDCLAQAANLNGRSEARSMARELLGTQGFERRKDRCCMCDNSRALSRKTR